LATKYSAFVRSERLDPSEGSAQLDHLAYSVTAGDEVATDGAAGQDRQRIEDGTLCTCEVTAALVYHLRPDALVEDYGLALDAFDAIRRAVLRVDMEGAVHLTYLGASALTRVPTSEYVTGSLRVRAMYQASL
jgi:hypothetical protein